MVKSVCIYENNKYIFVPLKKFLEVYCREIPEGWASLNEWINRLFESNNDYEKLAEEMQVEYFDINAIKDAYLILKGENYNLDDDVLKFIAFLFGTNYFNKIGNPPFDLWLNAADLNHPFRSAYKGSFSCMDALQFQFGQNAIRKKLMITLKWVSSQGG